MGKAMVLEEETLINELNLGRELAKQLKINLDPSASRESRELLIQKILSSYDKALSLLNLGVLVQEFNQGNAILDTSQSLAHNSFLVPEASKDQCRRTVNKKRKLAPGLTQQVRASPGGSGPAPLDDGYSWRKYGQKDILEAKFPRAYYRCTHRHVQGCMATKLVQRSDDDPSVFEITYRGKHTCVTTSHVNPPALALIGSAQDHYQPHQEHKKHCLSLDTLKVKTEEFNVVEENPPSFYFPRATNGNGNKVADTFPEFSKGNDFLETTESDLLSLFPYQMDDAGFIQSLGHSESDLSEMFSAPTSVSNSPTAHFGFSFDQVDSDPDFAFDTSEFFL